MSLRPVCKKAWVRRWRSLPSANLHLQFGAFVAPRGVHHGHGNRLLQGGEPPTGDLANRLILMLTTAPCRAARGIDAEVDQCGGYTSFGLPQSFLAHKTWSIFLECDGESESRRNVPWSRRVHRTAAWRFKLQLSAPKTGIHHIVLVEIVSTSMIASVAMLGR